MGGSRDVLNRIGGLALIEKKVVKWYGGSGLKSMYLTLAKFLD